MQKRTYSNKATGLLITFTGDEFVIIGDDELVSDDDLMALHAGDVVAGWDLVRA